MAYWIAAQLVVILHVGFVCFVVLGGCLVWRWRWVLFLHIPAILWGALIEFRGWICPLTPLEQWLRRAAGQAGYSGGFIEHYLLPVLYPSVLSREMQVFFGTGVVVINVIVYGWLIIRSHRR
ncbi:MAG: DUF2784 domain-containing protein [Deltaproteobacteria bacterium]|nr:DUF2784 domain-containing protein [Deltaproteobacteria bacterium]